ncbi:MAG: Uma2 family endonuclease [Isosphaeraceae bacterium]|nr:Uma2 family endonuclease [Isosphaeraceae bacterium]
MSMTASRLLSAEEYGRLDDPGGRTELVLGEIVPMSPPNARHGQVCAEIAFLLKAHARDLGHVLSNDSGIITRRDPDTVRGLDIMFYRYERLPRGPLPATWLSLAPDLVVEVRSPGDRRSELVGKAAEYLEAGAGIVLVVDPEAGAAWVHHASGVVDRLEADDAFRAPTILGDFAMTVEQMLG